MPSIDTILHRHPDALLRACRARRLLLRALLAQAGMASALVILLVVAGCVAYDLGSHAQRIAAIEVR
jgi:hypothetical protein